MFERILLAVDGSEHALKAARIAGEIARAFGSNLRLITVYDQIPTFLGEPNLQQAINAWLVEAEKILNGALGKVGTVPADVHTEMIEGDPGDVIVKVAKIRKSSVIVMGSRGLGRIAGLVLGSTSQKVVSQAPCQVVHRLARRARLLGRLQPLQHGGEGRRHRARTRRLRSPS